MEEGCTLFGSIREKRVPLGIADWMSNPEVHVLQDWATHFKRPGWLLLVPRLVAYPTGHVATIFLTRPIVAMRAHDCRFDMVLPELRSRTVQQSDWKSVQPAPTEQGDKTN